jgi:NADPH-dependent 2,4-dienoyl-CoA reductase/sulfur reductase-like enzyme
MTEQVGVARNAIIARGPVFDVLHYGGGEMTCIVAYAAGDRGLMSTNRGVVK